MDILLSADLPARTLPELRRIGIEVEQDQGMSLEKTVQRANRERALVMVPAELGESRASLLQQAPGVIALGKGAWGRGGLAKQVLESLRGFHPEPFLHHFSFFHGAGPSQAVFRTFAHLPGQEGVTLPRGSEEQFLHYGAAGVEELRRIGILHAGFTRTDRGYFVERRPATFHWLGVVLQGGLQIVPEVGSPWRASAGTSFVLQAGFRGFYRANGPVEFLWFHILQENFSLTAQGRTHEGASPHTRSLVQVARQMVEESRLDLPERPLVLLRLVQLMETQIHRVIRGLGLEGTESMGREKIQRAIRAVEETPAAAWTVTKLARTAGLSSSRLYREVRTHFRQTPGAMVQEIRIQRAAELLWQSGQKLQHVAALTGYADPFSFSRAFKRVMGVNPSAYRAHPKPGCGLGVDRLDQKTFARRKKTA